MADLTDAGEQLAAAALTEKPWIKLHKGAPGEEAAANAATETTRKQVTMGAPSGGVRASTTELEWPEVSTSETITHVSAWDAAEAGSPEWVAELAESKALTAGDALRIKAASLTFTLA